MKIIICGNYSQVSFVIRSFTAEESNKIIVICDSEKDAAALSKIDNITVFNSDPTKIYSYEISDVYDFDLIVSLLDNDANNFIACTIAKKLFNVKKSICTVNNPNNVNIFRDLGIASPISAPYLLSEKIKGESDINSLIKTMSLENSRIVITEIRVKKDFFCANKQLKNISLPNTGNITCIFRDPSVLIPRGDTSIIPGDLLIIASAPNDQKDLVQYIRKGRK